VRTDRFIDELKRRRVVRVAIVYGAAAFAIIQAADLVFPRIPLPDWTVSLVVWLAILGFPVALVLAWAFDITPAGIQRTPPSAPAGGAGPALPGRTAGRMAVAGLVVLAVIVGSALAFRTRRPATADAAFTSAQVLAVMPFDVRGTAAIAYLAEGMVDLLAAKLTGANQLRVVDARALLEFVRRQPASSPRVAARDAARTFGARHFVLGSIVEFGGRMQLRASLYALDRPNDVLVEASAQGMETELFDMVDALAAQLIAGLSDGAAGRLARVAAITTHSIDALRHYLAGERAYRAASFDEAVEHFDRALRTDSAFALAAYRLATAAMWTNERDLLFAALHAAHGRQANLPARERALLDAFTAFYADRHADAERMYREIVTQYPDDIDGWYMLGELVMHNGVLLGRTLADAIEPFERAIALSPSHSASLYHRTNLAALLGDTLGVVSWSDRFLEAGTDSLMGITDRAYLLNDVALQRTLEAQLPGVPEPINTYYAGIATSHSMATPDVARRVWTLIARTTPTPAVKALAHASLAHVEMAGGRFAAAGADLREAMRFAPHLGWQERVSLSLHPLRDAAPQRLRPLRDSLRSWTPPPAAALPAHLAAFQADHAGAVVREFLIGAIDARIDPEAARRTARALSGRVGDDVDARIARDLGALLDAELYRSAGDPAEALRRLEDARFWTVLAAPVDAGTLAFRWPAFLRAELLRETGRVDEAVHWYRVAADYAIAYRAPALERLCSLHATAGRTDEARTACGRFVALWQDADPELQAVVAEARARLERLQQDGTR
jgi:tetratricopeptide (TPR) repeat protein